MESIISTIENTLLQGFESLFNNAIDKKQITINETPKEFVGDCTLVVFPLLKLTKKNPEESCTIIGNFLKENIAYIDNFNIIKGFLNLEINPSYWIDYFNYLLATENVFEVLPKSKKILIEYSSPNTNKPLHLGHVRNNVLGFALAGIYKANGYHVTKANLINDRGIHICKSMLAWQKFGNNETPESSGLKGDKLVGKYYVEFDKQYKQQIEELVANGTPKEIAEKTAPIIVEAQQMLLKWEQNDADVIDLWKKMNTWVYSGFDITYKRLGVDFDKYYYESDTYLLGKEIIEEGLQKNIFFKKENGSVWIDLTNEGLDEKLVLRADGTSVYITQDLGTADLKYNDYKMDTSIYVVGNEQDYHFKVLKLILQKLEKPYANGVHHFSYGMVDLPSGKMKSREGTVVDADDLMDEMIENAIEETNKNEKNISFSDDEKNNLYTTIGLGALKFFLLRVDPKKRILFDPKESIDLHGYTGPYVQYAYARTRSVLRSWDEKLQSNFSSILLHQAEIDLIKKIHQYHTILDLACNEMNPAKIVDFAYDLARSYSRFYNECNILKEENITLKHFRIQLNTITGNLIKKCFKMLGIDVPERM